MSWKLWLAIAIGSAFLLFYLGGTYSFRYTHTCAHSHKKVIATATHTGANFQTITVCDAYSGNAKRWSVGDPVRALYSEPFTGWTGVILVGIGLAIGVAAFFERRKRRRPEPAG